VKEKLESKKKKSKKNEFKLALKNFNLS